MRVRNHMTPDPVTVKPGDPLVSAARQMRRFGVSHVPVVSSDGHVVGLVTQRELLGAALRGRGLEGIAVQDAMIEDPVTVARDSSVAGALNLINKKRLDCLPVVDENKRLVGIVTRADIVRVLVRLLGLEVDGSCVEVALVEPNRDLALAFEKLRDCKSEIISAICACVRDDGDESALYLRVTDRSPQRVERALVRAGLILLEPENHTRAAASYSGNGSAAVGVLTEGLGTECT